MKLAYLSFTRSFKIILQQSLVKNPLKFNMSILKKYVKKKEREPTRILSVDIAGVDKS